MYHEVSSATFCRLPSQQKRQRRKVLSFCIDLKRMYIRFLKFRMTFTVSPLSHERLVANSHELGTSQDSLETSQDGLGCVLASPCMSRQVTETEREIPFFSHRLVAAVDFILSREIKFSPPPATKMQLNCIGPSRLVPAS